MKRFYNLPIQQKMLLMTLLICSVVLLVAMLALFVFQMVNFRSSFERDTSTLAAIIANNSTAALSFKDDTAGNEVVGSLQAKPSVLSASLTLPDGTLFAHYGTGESARSLAGFPPPEEYRFADGALLFTKEVVLKPDKLGTLYLRMDYQ